MAMHGKRRIGWRRLASKIKVTGIESAGEQYSEHQKCYDGVLLQGGGWYSAVLMQLDFFIYLDLTIERMTTCLSVKFAIVK